MYSGTIPREIGDMVGLDFLYLEETQLSGTVPKQLAKLQQLDILYLDGE